MERPEEEDEGSVLEPDEPVADPPTEEELAEKYDGERDPEPEDDSSIDDVEREDNVQNPDDPIITEEGEDDGEPLPA